MQSAARSRWLTEASACADQSDDFDVTARPCTDCTTCNSASTSRRRTRREGFRACQRGRADMRLALGGDHGWGRMSIANGDEGAWPRRSAAKRPPLIADPYRGGPSRARALVADAPNQTENNGAKNPSAMPNSWCARRRGSPIAETTRPRAKPASKIDTCVVTASAHRANRVIGLGRNSHSTLG
jgi:hypothetical protein